MVGACHMARKRAAVDRIACSSSLLKPAHAYCLYLICRWHNYLCDVRTREDAFKGPLRIVQESAVFVNRSLKFRLNVKFYEMLRHESFIFSREREIFGNF